MKILAYDIPNTLNYGSMMMAENYMYYYSMKKGKAEFLVITPRPKETKERLSKATCQKVSVKTIRSSDVIGRTFFEKILCLLTGNSIKRFIKEEKIDEVVVFGGDTYSEDYLIIDPIFNLLQFLHYERCNVPVKMIGQTIGPFKSWRKLVFRALLSKVSVIYARDPITYEYLTKELKMRNVKLSADLAFLPLAKEILEGDENDEKWKLFSDDYATLVPSGLIWRYGKEKDRRAYVEFLVDICKYIINELKYKLVLLPHVVTENDKFNDLLLARDLYIYLVRNGFKEEDFTVVKDILLPYQARQILGGSRFVITGRMHAAISAFEQQVPAISLAYSRKYHGIIGEYFGMKDFIVDVRDVIWSKAKEIVIDSIKEVERNYFKIVEKIQENVRKMQKKLETVFD